MRNIALQCFAFWTILNQNAICMMVWDISSEASTYMASSESTTMDGRKEYAYDGNPDTCYRSDGNNGDLQTGYTFIYSSNYFIHGVVITTSHLGLGYILHDFVIDVFDSVYNRITCYREYGQVPEANSTLLYLCEHNSSTMPLIMTSIILKNQPNTGILTLCEVEVLGRSGFMGVFCRVEGYTLNGTSYSTSSIRTKTSCSILCEESNCKVYSVVVQDGGLMCNLYNENKFILDKSSDSDFYFRC